MLGVLDEKGKLVGDIPDLRDEQLLDLFRAMVAAREFDERVLSLQRTGRVPAYYQSSGQEASAAVALALAKSDWVVTAYREQPIRLARGVTIEEELAAFCNATDLMADPNECRITPLAATIGSQIPHGTGLAYGDRLLGRDTVTLVCFGDGATSEGDFHAGLNYAGVWKAPVVFFCQNNLYAQSTPIARQTAANSIAEKAGAYGITGIQVDGMDALAVYQAVSQAVDAARAGEGPTLIEAVMYRFAPHSSYDGQPVYRTREEEEMWAGRDPLLRMRILLEERELLSEGFEDEVRARTAADVEAAMERIESAGLPGREDPYRHAYAEPPAHLDEQLRTEQRVASEPITGLEVGSIDPDPSPAGETTAMSLVEALRLALDHALELDPTVVVLGEDVGVEGGVFRVTEGLLDRYGPDRIIDTPLSEVGILGTSVGMALAGLRPVAELEFAGLGYSAFDQLVVHAARYRWRTRGKITMPIVVRMPGGGGHEGYEGHSDNPEAYFVHTPGLTVVYPSNPIDAKGLMASALEAADPVVFFEPIAQYFVKAENVPVDHFTIPIGRARIVSAGSDVTLVTYGNAVHVASTACERLSSEGISVELIDLRTLKPWDRGTVLQSVVGTGRLVVAHEASVYGGVGAEIVATVTEKAGYSLETPPARVGHPDLVWARAKLEAYSLLTPEKIIDAVHGVMEA